MSDWSKYVPFEEIDKAPEERERGMSRKECDSMSDITSGVNYALHHSGSTLSVVVRCTCGCVVATALINEQEADSIAQAAASQRCLTCATLPVRTRPSTDSYWSRMYPNL